MKQPPGGLRASSGHTGPRISATPLADRLFTTCSFVLRACYDLEMERGC